MSTDTARCICDGGAFREASDPVPPFIVHPECPVHRKPGRSTDSVAADRERKWVIARMLDDEHLLQPPLNEDSANRELDALLAAVRHEHGERIAKAIKDAALYPNELDAAMWAGRIARDLSPPP